MRTRCAVLVLLAGLLAFVPVVPAAALDFGLGADLGLSVFMPSDEYEGLDGNFTTFGWPMSSGFFMGELPLPGAGGLRLSMSGANPAHEVWLGTSFNRQGFEGAALSSLSLTGNYQFNFNAQGNLKPFVTAGVGLFRVGYHPEHGDGMSASSAMFGGGAGVGYLVAGGVGRLRGEVRYDQVTEGKHEDNPITPKGGTLGFRLGFDVWLRAK